MTSVAVLESIKESANKSAKNSEVAPKKALILIGHGSLRKASGAAMIRLAALARKRSGKGGMAEISTAAFLNFSKPTLADSVARCVRKGATEIFVQPYFLIQGYYVETSLPQQLEEVSKDYPDISFQLGHAFGFQDALLDMVKDRYMNTYTDNPKHGLLLLAHGTPHPTANDVILETLEAMKQVDEVAAGDMGFMEINTPDIAQGVDNLVAQGITEITAIPYFLQLGRHVVNDLPEAIEAAQKKHNNVKIHLTDYLSYDEKILDAIESCIAEFTHKQTEMNQTI